MSQMHQDDYDISTVDDQRHISVAGMLIAAALFALALMMIVYAPMIWGISEYGSDVIR